MRPKATAAVPKLKEPLFVRLGADVRRNWVLYLMFAPILAWFILFRYFPMTKLVIAFQDFNPFKGVAGSPFVGLDNFTKFFHLRDSWRLIRNTFLLSFYSILFGFSAPILLALMINEVKLKRTKRVIQTISYMPHFISLVVICGFIRDFSKSEGLFNQIGALFGETAGQNLLSLPDLYRTIHIGSDIWQGVGFGSILYLATLSTVDPSLYEAAYIDGASRIRRIIHINLPALVPIITVQLIMRLGYVMSVGYEKIILLYTPLTYETADVISTYLYRYGLQGTKYSLGTAIGLLNSLVNIVLLVLVNKVFKRFTEVSLW